MVVMDEIAIIKNFFDSHQVRLSPVWLESCISWCKQENLPANYTIKDLQLKVYEQWLLLDLRDVEVPCLPQNLANKKLYTLNGTYSLQMMQVIDISKPKLWQIQKIRNSTSKNADEEVESSKRALQLTLTDGVQEVEAMEYKPIPSLNLNLTPGIKIRVMGPISVRRGRLMLQNQNVKVLGGEVEDLIIPNAAENILAKFLNLPLNPQPKIIEESLLKANKDIFDETGSTTNRTLPQNANNNEFIQPAVINRNNQQTQQSISHRPDTSVQIPVKQVKNNAIGLISDEEDRRIAAQIDLLMEMEREVDEPHPKRRKSRSTTPDMFADVDVNDSDFANIVIPDTVIRINQGLKKTPVVRESNIPVSSTPSDLDISTTLELDNDEFEKMDIAAHLDKIEKEINSLPEPKHSTPEKSKTPKPNIWSIEKLSKNIPNISNGKFKIKAKFKSVVEKLTVADDEFYFVVQVEDITKDITVRLHSDVVADMAGCSPKALLSLKSKILEKNAEAERKVYETLGRLKEKLIGLDNVVEVQVNAREKFPVLVKIL